MNLLTAKDLAPRWGVSLRRAQAIIKHRGLGRKIGTTWTLTAEEAAQIVIKTRHRRKENPA